MKFKLAMLAIAATTTAGSSMAATLYSQDFESNSSGFAGGSVVGSESLGASFGKNVYRAVTTPAATSTLSLSLGQAATGSTLSFSLAILDSWDGNTFFGPDAFTVKLDGNTLFSAIFDNYNGFGPTVAPGLTNTSYGSNLAVNSGFNDATYTMSLALGNLSAGAHTIDFIADGPGWQGFDDESYAVDNINIDGQVTGAVPEPSTYALMALGLAGIGFTARRRAAR